MDRQRLEQLLREISGVRIAVLGDFCLDAYWFYDPAGSEISIETQKPTRAVKQQRYGLGGAGNVVNNLIDLGVAEVRAFGVVGDDLFGRELVRMLQARGAHVDGMVVQVDDWQTPVYGKPHQDQREQNRIDFGCFNQLSSASQGDLIGRLEAALESIDGVIVNQQLPRGLWADSLIERFNQLVRRRPDKLFLVDSRDRAERFSGVALKLNDVEAARICGAARDTEDLVTAEQAREFAHCLSERTGRAVFITRGPQGLVAFDGRQAHIEPGVQILRKTDPVGAGDTSVSAIVGALAAGAGVLEAAALANFAAAVTVQKLRQTGTAAPAEIVEIGADADYVYRPELADDPRRARHLNSSEIELVGQNLELGRIEHVVFDHDGTISVLRQGWEAVMEPMMARAILGPSYMTADEPLYQRVVARVRDYIDKSTGVQTVVQMQALVEMVREYGCVPPDQVLDGLGYKAIYNKALLEVVRERLEKLRRGELEISDLTLKGAVGVLHMLRRRGVTLYLASGTDRQDVIAEAAALGYAELFDGRIYGALGDVRKYSKKMVIDRILTENKLAGPELACIGDGPVELRETRKRGGIAVGVASDEVRRYGLNRQKRSRLIKAGADLIVPDFSQAEQLTNFLFGVGSTE